MLITVCILKISEPHANLQILNRYWSRFENEKNASMVNLESRFELRPTDERIFFVFHSYKKKNANKEHANHACVCVLLLIIIRKLWGFQGPPRISFNI